MSWDLSFFPESKICGDPIALVGRVVQIERYGEGFAVLSSPAFRVEFMRPREENDASVLFASLDDYRFAMHAIWEICRACQWRAFDHQAGKFLAINNLRFEPVDDAVVDDDDDFTENHVRPELIELVYEPQL